MFENLCLLDDASKFKSYLSEMENIDFETPETRGKILLKKKHLHINSLWRDNM